MSTVLYYTIKSVPVYTKTYFPEQLVIAFHAVGIKAAIFPRYLQGQAI